MNKSDINEAVEAAFADLSKVAWFEDIAVRVKPGMTHDECVEAVYARKKEVNDLYFILKERTYRLGRRLGSKEPEPDVRHDQWVAAFDARIGQVRSYPRFVFPSNVYQRQKDDAAEYASLTDTSMEIVEHCATKCKLAGTSLEALTEADLEFKELLARHALAQTLYLSQLLDDQFFPQETSSGC